MGAHTAAQGRRHGLQTFFERLVCMRTIREYPTQQDLLLHFTYHDDAVKQVSGKTMRGALERNRLPGRLIFGTVNGGPTARAQLGFQQELWYLHRIIWIMNFGDIPAGLLVDHRDNDPSHNRATNLRLASPSLNQMNRRRARVDSVVPYIGVCVSHRKYSAFVSKNCKPIWLGAFHTPEEAAKVRDEAAVKLHGTEFLLNRDIFPELRD